MHGNDDLNPQGVGTPAETEENSSQPVQGLQQPRKKLQRPEAGG